MGEIEGAVRAMWPLIHSGHPGFDAEKGECVDCPNNWCVQYATDHQPKEKP